MKTVAGVLLFFWWAGALFGAICPGQRFDVTIKEPIGLKDAVLNIVEECGLSLSLEGRQSTEQFEDAQLGYITLRGATAQEALSFMIRQANFHHEIDENLLTLRYLDTRTFKIDYINLSRSANSNSDIKIGGSAISGSSTGGEDSTSSSSGAMITTEENFDFWGTLEVELAQVLYRPEDAVQTSGKETIVVNPRSGLVTVTGTQRQLKRVARYIEQTLDALKKQVLIDVQIIAVDLDGSHATGIDWAQFPLFMTTAGGSYNYNSQTHGSSASDGATTFVADTGEFEFNLRGFLNFLRTYGEAQALSNPKVMAMNNQPSLISVGENINYALFTSREISEGRVETSATPGDLFVGVLLDITPQIDQSGFITLRINPSVSELKYADDNQRRVTPREIAPDTITRRISSVVRVQDAQVVVLGGLISRYNQREESKVPVLGSIPFLGKLFGATRTVERSREIVFVLTPHIVKEGQTRPPRDLGFTRQTDEAVRLPSLRSFHE
jgi:general secretion pathway protein D